jgi:hypothetical protein
VAHGVVDEVGDQPFEQYPVPGDLRILQCRRHPDVLGRRSCPGEVDGVFDRSGQVDNFSVAESAVGAGECQQRPPW